MMKGVKQGPIPRWLLQGFSSYEMAKKFARQGKRGHLSKHYQTPGKSTVVWSPRAGTYMKPETLQRKQQFVAACVAKRREDEARKAEKNARGQS